MGLGFKGGFAAFMDGYNKQEAVNLQRDRQAKDDEWTQKQRARQEDEQQQSKKLKDDMAAAVKDVETEVPNFVMQSDDAGNVPAVKEKRAQTAEEKLRNISKVYSGVGNVEKAIELEGAANKLTMQDYATKFNQLRSGASALPIKDQLDKAVQIFNDAPNAGTISNVRYDDKGAVTFDALNKVTGQKITKTFSDPKQLLDDFHSYYSQGSWQQESEARRKEAADRSKLQAFAPGSMVTDRDGNIKFMVPGRTSVGGVGGRGGSDGPDEDLPIAQGNQVKWDKLYAKNASAIDKEQEAGVIRTPEEKVSETKKRTDKEFAFIKADEKTQAQKRAIVEGLRGLDPRDLRYQNTVQRLRAAGTPDSVLIDLGVEIPKASLSQGVAFPENKNKR